MEYLEAACELISWYRARWDVKMLFDILKTGCRVERLQLESRARNECALALCLVVSWRTNYLMRLGRECPTLSCEVMLAPDEWRGTYVLAKKDPPKAPSDLNKEIRLVARACGFLSRKGDGHLGGQGALVRDAGGFYLHRGAARRARNGRRGKL